MQSTINVFSKVIFFNNICCIKFYCFNRLVTSSYISVFLFVRCFRWFNFEKVIEALVAKSVYHMKFAQLQTYAKEVCFIEDDDQFHTMLTFYHDLGMIVKHRNTVILKAQWLIELFKKLITIPPFEKAVRAIFGSN